MSLNAKGLITQELHDEMINGRDIDSKKAAKLVNAIQNTLTAHINPETYLNEVCSALKDIGEKQITDIVNKLEQAGASLESPPTMRHGVQHTGLITSHLVNILDLLKKHGYSGVDYYHLGLHLGLFPSTLNVIKEDNKGNVRSCLRECLTAWLKQRDNVKSKGLPTYDSLIQALRDEEENAVADGIERDSIKKKK